MIDEQKTENETIQPVADSETVVKEIEPVVEEDAVKEEPKEETEEVEEKVVLKNTPLSNNDKKAYMIFGARIEEELDEDGKTKISIKFGYTEPINTEALAKIHGMTLKEFWTKIIKETRGMADTVEKVIEKL